MMDATLISTEFCKRSDHFFPKSLVIQLPVWRESFRSQMFTIISILFTKMGCFLSVFMTVYAFRFGQTVCLPFGPEVE